MGAPHGSNKSACLMRAVRSCYWLRPAISMGCTVVAPVTMLLLELSALFGCLTDCACIWACEPEETHLLCCSLSQSLLLPFRLHTQAQQQKLTAKSQKKFGKRLQACNCTAEKAALQPLVHHLLLPSHQSRSAMTCLAAHV